MNFSDFVPASKAEALAVGLPVAPALTPDTAAAPAPAAPAASAPPVVATPAPASPLFVGQAARSRAFPLEHPVSFEGRVYDTVWLARPSSRRVGEFFEEMQTVGPGGLVYFPVYVDAAGAPIPVAVLDHLDDDDMAPMTAVLADFLPRRLLALRAVGDLGSDPSDGGNTAPTS